MPSLPTLQTVRLTLRPFAPGDAPHVQALAGDEAVAATTLLIPHPYPDGAAEAWIGTHQEKFDQGSEVNLAVTLRRDRALLGAVGLRLAGGHHRAELGYWIGRPYWNQGYASEAAAALVAWGFRILELNRVHAHHMVGNPASGRVLEKCGMVREGLIREHVRKGDRYRDLVWYGILKREHDLRPGGEAKRRGDQGS